MSTYSGIKRTSFLTKAFSQDSLMMQIEEAYSKFFTNSPWQNARDVISSDENSAAFIRWILDDADYREFGKSDVHYQFAKKRATHSVITFFIGVLFLDSFQISDSISKSFRIDLKGVLNLWMVTSLYHDWAYHSEYISRDDVDYRSIVKFYLLDDEYSIGIPAMSAINNFSESFPVAMAYTYDEIEAYDVYARRFHSGRKDTERLDHGILGGIMIFDRLIKRLSKANNSDFSDKKDKTRDLITAKAGCLAIAQHNIFKSSSPEDDIKYGPALAKLHSTSNFVISVATPLLLLLSLVDTFECVKRLSKEETEGQYVTVRTVLEKISIYATERSITADFSELEKHIRTTKNPSLYGIFNDHFHSLCSINSWTAITGADRGNFTVEFTITN